MVHLSCSCLTLLAVSLMMVSSAGTLSGAEQPSFGWSTVRLSEGTVRLGYGTVRLSQGTVRLSFGTVRLSDGTAYAV